MYKQWTKEKEEKSEKERTKRTEEAEKERTKRAEEAEKERTKREEEEINNREDMTIIRRLRVEFNLLLSKGSSNKKSKHTLLLKYHPDKNRENEKWANTMTLHILELF